MMTGYKLRIISLFMTVVTVISSLIFSTGLCVGAEEIYTEMASTEITYKEYITDLSALNDIIIEADILNPYEASENGVSVDADNKVLNIAADSAFVTYTFNVEKAGYYQLGMDYCPIEHKSVDIAFSVKINGKIPFEEAQSFRLYRTYKDDGEIRQDVNGNDIKPQKKEIFERKKVSVYDAERIYGEPCYFKLEAGENTITLDFSVGYVSIYGLWIYTDSNTVTYEKYEELSSGKKDNADNSDIIKIQAETPLTTSSNSIYATYDRQSAVTESSDGSKNNPAKLKLNTFGQSNWKMPGQTVTYGFEVKNSGYYEIGLRFRQNVSRGVFSTRKIEIDGKLLFEELSQVRFDYSRDWQIKTLGDGDSYRIYLEAGRHTISFESVAGILGEYVNEFSNVINELNSIYRKIIMITGTTPDVYRDYDIEKKIPDLISRFEAVNKRLGELKKGLSELRISNGSNAVVIDEVLTQIESFINKPRTIPERISKFQNNISSLSALATSLNEQPLEIDYIFIQKPDAADYVENPTFFETIGFRLKSFMSSFVEDYTSISNETDVTALNVWVNLNRDQTQIIKDLIDSDFSTENNIKINLSLVQQDVVQAIAANRAPDVLMYSGEIINLAARGALVDLSGFDGFDEVKARFSQNAFIQYEFEGGVYALPMQQNFQMMFYRTDILNELGIAVPETWDDLYKAIKILQKNNLTVGVPVDAAIFATLLYQRGGSFYNDDLSATAFDSEEAVAAFTTWTEFYTKYSLPLSYDMLTRFRSGEIPILFESYTAYNNFSAAAPEIKGLWQMAPMPATVAENGELNNISICTTTPACMLSTCKNKAAAWEFLKWFSDSKAQSAYGIAVENVLGAGSRYSTANLKALEQLYWTQSELEVLLGQINNSTFTPSIPAAYYVSRNINNAFRAVTVKGMNPREALYQYNIDINSEITRKRKELGLE